MILILFGFNCVSQVPHLSRYERIWAIWHPFAAIKIKRINTRAAQFYNPSGLRSNLDNFSSGGKLDAFRHVYFMAAFAQKVSVKKLRKLGIAHEKANYRQFLKGEKEEGELPDSLSSVMDLFNNELGFKIGSSSKNSNYSDLKTEVIKKISNGEALIFKRNLSGQYLDCNGTILRQREQIKQWGKAGCLVRSDDVYKD